MHSNVWQCNGCDRSLLARCQLQGPRARVADFYCSLKYAVCMNKETNRRKGCPFHIPSQTLCSGLWEHVSRTFNETWLLSVARQFEIGGPIFQGTTVCGRI